MSSRAKHALVCGAVTGVAVFAIHVLLQLWIDDRRTQRILGTGLSILVMLLAVLAMRAWDTRAASGSR